MGFVFIKNVKIPINLGGLNTHLIGYFFHHDLKSPLATLSQDPFQEDNSFLKLQQMVFLELALARLHFCVSCS